MAALGLMSLVSFTRCVVLVGNTNELSEVAFVGKAPGTYLMLLGGGYYGQRLNKIYRGQDLLYTRCRR